MLAIALGVVDNERTTSLSVSAASKLTLTGSQLSRLLNLDDIWTSANSLEKLNSKLGLDESSSLEDSGGDDKWYFGNGRDAVTTGKEEGGNGGSSDSRGSSEAPVNVSCDLELMACALTSGSG